MENLQEIQGITELLLSENEDSRNLVFELVKSLGLVDEVRDYLHKITVDSIFNSPNHKEIFKDFTENPIEHFGLFQEMGYDHEGWPYVEFEVLEFSIKGVKEPIFCEDSECQCLYEKTYGLIHHEKLTKPLTEKEIQEREKERIKNNLPF